MKQNRLWLDATRESLAGYRKMIDAALVQLSDEQLFRRPRPELNSVAVLLRHLGGNLQSRWTNFLDEDGEKPDRRRDKEFEDWTGSRAALLSYFEVGFDRFVSTIDLLSDEDLSRMILIRGESHSVPGAILRSLTHLSYHVGQLLYVARLVHGDDSSWDWLTIRPGGSEQHNAATWGTSGSRGVAGKRRA
jgi:hypothetical protein